MPPQRKRLTPEEHDQIVRLKLERVPVRQIAANIGCNPLTVTKTWNRYLASRSAERRADLEMAFEDTIARLEKNATDARRGYTRAVRDEAHSDATRYLNAERQALVELAKLGVVRDDAPTQAARVTAAQTAALLAAVRTATSNLPPDIARVTVERLAGELRAIEAK